MIGNTAVLDNVFSLTVKAISTETAEVVAAGRCRFDATPDLMKLFSTVLIGGAGSPTGAGSPVGQTPSVQDVSGIATKKYDNLEIVLKSVTPLTVKGAPAISCALNCSTGIFEVASN